MQSAHVLATGGWKDCASRSKVSEPMDLEQYGRLRSLDTAWLTDGFFPDLAMYLKIRKARTQLDEMQPAVDSITV